MTHLVVAGKLHPVGVDMLEKLRTKGVTIDYVEEISEPSYAPYIHKADALVIRTQPLSSETIAKAEKLKVVSRHGVGYDGVDVNALNERSIALTIVGDVNSKSVAEHAMMQLLAASKRIIRSDRSVRDPELWSWRNNLESQEVSGKKLLIIGYGRSGQHLAKMAAGFDMTVRAYDPFLKDMGWPEGDVECVKNLLEGLAWADCVSLHTPKTYEPLLGEQELQHVKPGVIIVNSARGGVVDEEALAKALNDGRVGAAALDVFKQEPPTDGSSPLFALDNVVLSPHIAGLTEEAAMRMAISSIENAMDYLEGTIDPSFIVKDKL